MSPTLSGLRKPLFLALAVAAAIVLSTAYGNLWAPYHRRSVVIVDNAGERSRLSIDPKDYVGDDTFKVPEEMPRFPRPSRPHPGNKVPSVVHYAYGFHDEPPNFPYWSYLAVRSAIECLRPDTIYLQVCLEWHAD
jgi:hypothetical protein